MNNEQREQQMMTSAEAYAAEIYKDEPDNFHTDEQLCETINDFCAGWRAADNSRWIPVEELVPDLDDDVLVYDSAENRMFVAHHAGDWYTTHGDILLGVTHWMEIVPPRKEEDNE